MITGGTNKFNFFSFKLWSILSPSGSAIYNFEVKPLRIIFHFLQPDGTSNLQDTTGLEGEVSNITIPLKTTLKTRLRSSHPTLWNFGFSSRYSSTHQSISKSVNQIGVFKYKSFYQQRNTLWLRQLRSVFLPTSFFRSIVSHETRFMGRWRSKYNVLKMS